MKERIQKILAQAGYGSRREIEKWLAAGRVTVNQKLVSLGDKAASDDLIALDGKILPITAPEELPCRVIMYHKPEGQLCSRSDPEKRDLVFDHLPQIRKARWVMIGRLDLNTAGLLLFTTNGELANRLMHPSYQIEREYAVRVYGEVTSDILNNLQKGVKLEDGVAKFEQITPQRGEGKNQWFHVMLREGKNREVRRLWESQDVTVSRLIRIRYGDIVMPRDLHLGDWRDLSPFQIRNLAAKVQLEVNPYVKKAVTRR